MSQDLCVARARSNETKIDNVQYFAKAIGSRWYILATKKKIDSLKNFRCFACSVGQCSCDEDDYYQ